MQEAIDLMPFPGGMSRAYREQEREQQRAQWRDERFAHCPGLLVRVLAVLLRPIIWEAMRQHPSVDHGRFVRERMLTFKDAALGRNRHLGEGA